MHHDLTLWDHGLEGHYSSALKTSTCSIHPGLAGDQSCPPQGDNCKALHYTRQDLLKDGIFQHSRSSE